MVQLQSVFNVSTCNRQLNALCRSVRTVVLYSTTLPPVAVLPAVLPEGAGISAGRDWTGCRLGLVSVWLPPLTVATIGYAAAQLCTTACTAVVHCRFLGMLPSALQYSTTQRTTYVPE